MLPFLCGGATKWKEISSLLIKTLGVKSIMLFMPDPERFSMLFTEGTEADWAKGSASAIWNIHEGTVLWAEGLHTRASLQKQGKPLDEFLPEKDKRQED
jgi:hypothetical protein